MTVIVLGLITFILMKSVPGGPWDATSPDRKGLSSGQQAILNQQFGLDKPEWRQFVAYMFADWNNKGEFVCGAICGNLGPSFKYRGQMVSDRLFKPANEDAPWYESRMGHSLRMALVAMSFGLIIGVPSGLIAALRRNTWVDHVFSFVTTVGVSVPGFVLAIFIMIVFGVFLKVIRVIPDWKVAGDWLIPSFLLGSGSVAALARYTRGQMLEVMQQDYIRTARAKGAREILVILKHMLRNSLIPVVTALGPILALLIAGSFAIEVLYSFPGIGAEFVTSIFNRDYSIIMGTTLFLGVLAVFATFFVDLLYVVLDPRIRLN
jgi:oligopeptide transport system permease protein